MVCAMSQGVKHRSIPVVLPVARSKIYALSHRTFLTMECDQVGIITHARLGRAMLNVDKRGQRAGLSIPPGAVAMVSRS